MQNLLLYGVLHINVSLQCVDKTTIQWKKKSILPSKSQYTLINQAVWIFMLHPRPLTDCLVLAYFRPQPFVSQHFTWLVLTSPMEERGGVSNCSLSF